jgi:hypothetical protein
MILISGAMGNVGREVVNLLLDGVPPTNPAVTLLTPNDQPSDKVTTATASTSPYGLANFSIGWIVGIAILVALLLVGIVVVLQRRKAHH